MKVSNLILTVKGKPKYLTSAERCLLFFVCFFVCILFRVSQGVLSISALFTITKHNLFDKKEFGMNMHI